MSCVRPIVTEEGVRGAVGLEVAISGIHEMLLEFTRSFGEGTRCILLRPFVESPRGSATPTEVVYRAIVDTAHTPDAHDRHEGALSPRVEEINSCVAAYVGQIHSGDGNSRECEILEGLLLAHRRFEDRDWVLIATTMNR
jgi:hypothetical protein